MVTLIDIEVLARIKITARLWPSVTRANGYEHPFLIYNTNELLSCDPLMHQGKARDISRTVRAVRTLANAQRG
jgi:hypothetical protein